MPSKEDFLPDADGLAAAVQALIEARRQQGSPHADPAAPLGLPHSWPEEGLGGREALSLLAGAGLERVTRLDHPGFLAHMDPPTPWVTWAAAMWAAAMNQNLLHPDTAPAARQLESLVVGWLAPAFGMDGGHMLPGSTLANLTALWAARELTGAGQVICSSAAHLSITKAARILGLRLVQVPADTAQRLRPDLLPDTLADSIVVLTAGTVATGAIDPLLAADGAAWRHVDAAWAGPLRLSSHAALLDGIQTADSMSVSAHKWLYQPKPSALVLFRHAGAAHEALSFAGGYLAAPNIGLLGSSANVALPLAATLLASGRRGLAARIDEDMAVASKLANLIEDAPELQLWRQPVTAVINWRPRREPAEQVRARLDGAWVSTTTIAGETWFRSVACNPRVNPHRIVQAALGALRR